MAPLGRASRRRPSAAAIAVQARETTRAVEIIGGQYNRAWDDFSTPVYIEIASHLFFPLRTFCLSTTSASLSIRHPFSIPPLVTQEPSPGGVESARSTRILKYKHKKIVYSMTDRSYSTLFQSPCPSRPCHRPALDGGMLSFIRRV